jgi:hypothetical protein
MDNQVTFNGPRFKIAFASGSVVKKTPNPSTGRADYFGTSHTYIYRPPIPAREK